MDGILMATYATLLLFQPGLADGVDSLNAELNRYKHLKLLFDTDEHKGTGIATQFLKPTKYT